jgi:hypothetical protein
MSDGRPLINPEAPGGMSAWMGYLAGKMESVEDRQNRQNGSVERLVDKVGKLPCAEHAKDIDAAISYIKGQRENTSTDTRTRKRDLREFGFRVALVVLGALSVIITNAITAAFC